MPREMVEQDEEMIQDILRVNVVPDDIRTEYFIRMRIIHRYNAGGPMGIDSIVAMLRYLNYQPPQEQLIDERGKVNWRQVPDGTPLELRIGREWERRGTFAGKSDGGMLAVEIDGHVDEIYEHQVRLPDDVDLSDDASDIMADDEEEEESGNPRFADREPSDQELNAQNEVEAELEVGDIGSDDELDESDVPQEDKKFNWGHVKKGESVWYIHEGKKVDAVFVCNIKPEQAKIIIDGEDDEIVVKRSDLRY